MTPQVSLFPAPRAPRRVPRAVGRWFADAYPGWVAPGHVQRHLDQRDRRAKAADFARIEGLVKGAAISRGERAALEERITDESSVWSVRRQIAGAVADRLEAVNGGLPPSWLAQVADSVRRCRTAGTVGVRADNSSIVAWDCKCSHSRICPDCARAQSARVSERYGARIDSWLAARPGRRWRYAVLTAPNRPLGELLAMKRELMALTRSWVRSLPAVVGALVAQEDPLSWRGDWHVHQNVILLIEGNFDYSAARAAWGWNAEFSEPRAGGVRAAVRELIKYSVQSVPTKSAAKAARHDSPAPPLVDWSDAALVEWAAVQTGQRAARRRAPFRRLRSYGCLHSLDAWRWNDAPLDERMKLARLANGVPNARALPDRAAVTSWSRMDKKWGKGARAALLAAWDAVDGLPLERVPLDEFVTWLGVVGYVPDEGAFKVDLIPDNNFFEKSTSGGDFWFSARDGPPPNH